MSCDLAYQDEQVSPCGCIQFAARFCGGVVKEPAFGVWHADGRPWSAGSALGPYAAVAQIIHRYWGGGDLRLASVPH
jgi:hypothetical protein